MVCMPCLWVYLHSVRREQHNRQQRAALRPPQRGARPDGEPQAAKTRIKSRDANANAEPPGPRPRRRDDPPPDARRRPPAGNANVSKLQARTWLSAGAAGRRRPARRLQRGACRLCHRTCRVMSFERKVRLRYVFYIVLTTTHDSKMETQEHDVTHERHTTQKIRKPGRPLRGGAAGAAGPQRTRPRAQHDLHLAPEAATASK